MNTVRINGQDYTSSLSDAEIAFMGNFSLPTTAQTLSDAINEHESDISTLNSNLTSLTSNYTKQLTTQISDLNTPLSQGTSVIIFNTYDSTASNKPTGNSGFTITLGVRGYRQQMAIDLDGNIYARYYNNGTITSWVKRSAS